MNVAKSIDKKKITPRETYGSVRPALGNQNVQSRNPKRESKVEQYLVGGARALGLEGGLGVASLRPDPGCRVATVVERARDVAGRTGTDVWSVSQMPRHCVCAN